MKASGTFSFSDIIIPLCMGITVLAVYIYTLCPTVYLIDSGELAAVSYTLGIAHPTGYPLYTLISYLFARAPGEPIVNANIFSAALSVIAALLMYAIARRLTRDRMAALLPALLFAFAPTIWRISITNEVYPLTAVFTVLILLLLQKTSSMRRAYILLYCIGLAFTNHIIIFSIALPVIIYLLITRRPAFKHIFYGIILCLLGLSLYIYLIARYAGSAVLAWGGTYNVERLLWHITGKQYQVWMFTLSMNEILNNFVQGLGMIARNFLYVFLIPVIAGFIHLYRTARSSFWLYTSIVAINFLYAVNYSIPDIESYYIPAFCALVIVSIHGLARAQRYLKWYTVLPAGILIMLVNHNACSLRHTTFADDFSRAHFEPLPANSLVICTFWDIYSPALYFQHVKDQRTDLVIIDKELLRRTWYIHYLKRTYPAFYAQGQSAIEAYLPELMKFEYGEPYNPQVIQTRYIQMLQTFIVTHLTANDVYLVMPYPDNDLCQIKFEYPLVPYGFVFRIQKDTTSFHPFDFSRVTIHNPVHAYDERLIHNRDLVKRMVQGNISYMMQHNDTTAAIKAQQWLTDFTVD
ncbi:DUF2723 domain-containing protein [candidate division WOR-3 bacterium]|nr:DUF2723 domain-containing protein [candidate division WOR-3 bacterium]